MPADLLFNVAINLALGVTLLLAWVQDRRQAFTRWLGLSFLISALWAPGYLALVASEPGWQLAGGLLWAGQISLCQWCLAIGVAQLSGWQPQRRSISLIGAALLLVNLAALGLGSRAAILVPAVAMLLIGLGAARYLWRGPMAERIAAALLVVHGLAWLLVPLGGDMLLQAQTTLIGISRLLLGLALLATCLQRSAHTASRAASQLTRLIEGSHQGVLVVQGDRMMYANRQLLQILGLPDSAAMHEEWRRWRSSDTRGALAREGLPSLLRGEVRELDLAFPWQRRDGSRLHLRLTAWLVEWEGQPAAQIVVSDDTLAHESAARLLHQATHDRLTGLPNGLPLREQLAQHSEAALLVIDIDNFRAINDSLGFQAGDAFLQLVAARLANVAAGKGTLARLSADEFLLLTPGAGAAARAAALAQRALAAMRSPFALHGLSLTSTVTIGIACAPEHGQDYDSLLANANIAARLAKQAGRNTLRFFNESMNAHLREDLQLTTELQSALALGQLELHYQPIHDAHSGRITGAEALLRWQHPQRGLVSPARFIPLAERSGLIVDIGAWVIDQACARVAAWQRDPALADLVLSSNVSVIQCARGDLDQIVRAALMRHQTPAHKIELEITESALIHEPDAFVAMLQRLKALGLHIAIDDFGTGYSNLAYLQRFQVDKLKIDQRFVQRLQDNQQDTAIVRAIIQMAKSLALHTTAEGIEDAGTRSALLDLGCDQLQGYLFSRPLPLAQFESLLRAAQAEDAAAAAC